MDLVRAAELRHAVRDYKKQPLKADDINVLVELIDELNERYGLHIQLAVDEPKSFRGFKAFLGGFSNVNNYLCLVGPKASGTDAVIGYAGEELVLLAQQLGLNTCWVYATYRAVEDVVKIEDGEKLYIEIAFGYGVTQGDLHKSKKFEDVSKTAQGDAPDWYKEGVRLALLAPTAMNKQKFTFELAGGNKVKLKAGSGACTGIDLGIVKKHFEIGAGTENFEWA